jgi:non-ribosomal peptide synthetase component F
VVPGTLVAICAERSLDLLVAVLGILKAGGAYLPIDPAYPAERQRFMIEESRAPFILTQRHIVSDLPSTPAQAICLDDPSSPVWTCPSDNPIHIGTCQDLAYVIYTSGSTGLPKGVEVSHQNVGRLFNSTHCLFNFSEHEHGPSFIPALSTSPSGRCGAPCFMADVLWLYPSTRRAHPSTSTSFSRMSASQFSIKRLRPLGSCPLRRKTPQARSRSFCV